MRALFILNDPPYGTERCYNGLISVAPAGSRPARDAAAEIRAFTEASLSAALAIKILRSGG